MRPSALNRRSLALLSTLAISLISAGCKSAGDRQDIGLLPPPALLEAPQGTFIADKTVTSDEVTQFYASEHDEKRERKKSLGWKTKYSTSWTDSTFRKRTQVSEQELIQHRRAERDLYRIIRSESDTAGYSLTNQVSTGSISESIGGLWSDANIEIPGATYGDPQLLKTPSVNALDCLVYRENNLIPQTTEQGRFTFAEDATTVATALRTQSTRVVRFLCGPNHDTEHMGTEEFVMINSLSTKLFQSQIFKFNDGTFVGSSTEEYLLFNQLESEQPRRRR